MIVRNAVAQLTALGTIVIVQAAYSIAAARLLGVEAFGQFSFVFSITQILFIGCDLGFHNTALRKIASYTAENRQADAEEVFCSFFSLKILLSIGLVGCAATIAAILPEKTETRYALILFAGGMFFQSLNMPLNVTFQSRGQLYLGSLNNVVMAALNLGLSTAFMLLGGRVAALGFAYMLAMAAAFLLNWKLFHRHVHPLRVGQVGQVGQLAKWRDFVRESLPVGLGTLFNTVAARIDMTMLALMVGSYQTGIYSAAYRIYGTLLNIPIAVFSAVLPAMASFGQKRDGVRVLFDRSIVLMAALSLPLAIGLSRLSGVVTNILYGPVYAPSAAILSILAWSLIPSFIGMAFSHVILSQKTLSRRLPEIAAAAMVGNIGLNFLLIPSMGNKGAALGTLGTEILLALMYAAGARGYLFGTPVEQKTADCANID